MITNEQLNSIFVSPQVRAYLHKKLKDVAPEEVDKRIEELLKFLNMAVYSKGPIPFNEAVDEVWHFWILETQEYFKLCSKLCGGIYFHHTSNDFVQIDNPESAKESLDPNRSFELLLSYVLNYGGFKPDRIGYWPTANLICQQQFDGHIDQFNAWLKANLEVHTDRIAISAS